MKEISLYIHIPFCVKKCYYCDFISCTHRTEEEIELYIDSLKQELELYSQKLKDYNIYTIFIGGGTPSSINEKYIFNLLEYINKNFNTENIKEITIEVNPGTLTKNKALVYKKAGINRVSLGLQTTNNKTLNKIGRTHSYNDFLESYKILQSIGFDNINIDLIFGLPNQTVEDVLLDIERVSELNSKHISYYSLILEGDTPMEQWAKEGRYKFPTDLEDRNMYHSIVSKLKVEGYEHYEISNFSKPGYSSYHNKVYWEIKDYIGIGVGSHSNFKNKRFWNYSNINDYINKIRIGEFAVEDFEIIDREEKISEYCIFGIRLIEGINKNKFKDRFKVDIYDIYNDEIKKHKKTGLLIDDGDNIKFTKKGLDLANIVEMDFLL